MNSHHKKVYVNKHKMQRGVVKMRGLSFEIPNGYGKYLDDILGEINIEQLNWKVEGVESYLVENNTLGKPLFPYSCIMSGKELRKKISSKDYYLIFVDFKGFPKISGVGEIATYQEFAESECEFVLLVVDSSYVMIYLKDLEVIKQIYLKAVTAGYKNVKYITDENDTVNTLITF